MTSATSSYPELSVSVLTDGPRLPTGNEHVIEVVRAVYNELVAD